MEERWKSGGRVEEWILNVLSGYEKKARISQKEAPAVRKVYRTCVFYYTISLLKCQ